MKNKHILVLIISLVSGLIIMPLIALVTFGILSSITSISEDEGNVQSSILCTGETDDSDFKFMGYVSRNDEDTCLLLDSEGRILYKDTNYKNLKPSPSEIQNQNENVVDISSILVLFFRIILYCSICLIPIFLLIGIVSFIKHNIGKK